MEWTPRPLVEHLREQERHNVTVITVGSKYEVYVRSPASSHMQPFNNPFETLAIKWEVNIFEKKSSCVFILRFPSCVLYSCVCYHCVGMYPVYICMQHILIWCMCQQSSSRIQNEPGYRKRQFLSITTRHQWKWQRKLLELNEVKKRKKQEQTSNKKRGRRKEQTDAKRTEKKTERKKRKREKKIVSRALIHVTSISLCYLNWVK